MEVANTSIGHLSIFEGGRTIPIAIEGGWPTQMVKKKKKKRETTFSSHEL
jgi:hypothetical protein